MSGSYSITTVSYTHLDVYKRQAEMVGYTDPKYMSRVFKEETGMLPLEYRKKNS